MTIHLSDLPESSRTLLREQTIELPSWAFGNSGTRFKVFPSPGTPRNAYEKIDDAAQVHRFTGITPRVSLHIPWDVVDDFSDLAGHARSQGITLGTINSNVFQDDDYKFGSLTNSDEAVRRKAIDAHLRCIDVMNATGSDTLKIWLGDGTNYPGQDSIAARQERLADSLSVIYENLAPHQRLLLEYKFFEPAFYHTDVPDWGTALAHVIALGERAVVCLDTGHHAPGTNIEFSGVNFMLDQCHNLEEKIPGEILSAMNVQEATAKALLVDRDALATAQAKHDVLTANQVLMDAFSSDVRPLLGELREEQGLDPDPLAAYAASGYFERISAERVGGQQASWGA